MAPPTGGDYRSALQNPSFCLRDPELKSGSPVLDGQGLPRAVSGQFASVFQIRPTAAKTYAVKCFTRYAADQQQRYRAISSRLGQLNATWKVNFIYSPDGILVHGNWYPLLKMEWLDARQLIPFIDAHINEPKLIASVARSFAAAATELERAGIGHGDLQHGNILVTPSGDVRLIDYDGMFVRDIRTLGAIEKGHRNYQSPNRSREFSETIDRFSAWLIYASLVALTIDPSLWMLLHTPGDEFLLLKQDDYIVAAFSNSFAMLRQSPMDNVQAIGTALQTVLTRPITQIPPLDVDELPPPSEATTALPPPPQTIASSGGAEWIASHFPIGPRVRFAGNFVLTRVCLMLVLLAGGLIAAVSMTQRIHLDMATLASAASAIPVLMIATLILGYTYQPEWDRRRSVRRRVVAVERETKRLKRELAGRGRDLEDLQRRERTEIEGIARAQHDLQQRQTQAMSAIDRDVQQRIGGLHRRIAALDQGVASRLGQDLANRQQQHVRTRLAGHGIDVPGFGSALISRLARVGVRTAADFEGVTIGKRYTGYRNYSQDEALVVLANGRRIHVEGIGPKKGQALDRWRKSLAAAALKTAPRTADPNAEQRIRQEVAAEKTRLQQQLNAARQAGDQRKREGAASFQGEMQKLNTRSQQLHVRFAQERMAVENKYQPHVLAESQAQSRLVNERRDVARYADITFGRFCFAVIGRRSRR